MKLIHLSDLHIGKRIHEYSLIEDQEYILKKIINIIDDENPDAVIIAGDIYDKSVPSVEAVECFDDFLFSLSKRNSEVIVISGNHDSPERLAFGNRLMGESGIHISSAYNGETERVTIKDEYGTADIYMLPFIKPASVRRYFPDTEINSYTDAVKVAVENMQINPENRNVLVTHQFVTGASRSDSEDVSVGGTDNVDESAFDGFDYVALGHIHGPQNITSERIRYCGTPLKYSFSEAKHQKSVSVIELKNKGELDVRVIPLVPKRDMVELKGTFDSLMLRSFYEGTSYKEDYVSVTLTDEEEVPNAMARLRTVYHNIMKIGYDNERTRSRAQLDLVEDIEKKYPIDLFSELYEKQNAMPMTDEQNIYISNLIDSIWRENK